MINIYNNNKINSYLQNYNMILILLTVFLLLKLIKIEIIIKLKKIKIYVFNKLLIFIKLFYLL